MNLSDLKKLRTGELIAIYNTHAKKPILSFQSRKIALRRTQFLLESLGTQAKIDAPPPPELAAAHRKTASKVFVSGIDSPELKREYSSLKQAFESLRIPLKHLRTFRQKLKLAGRVKIDQFIFTATFKDEEK